MLEVVTKKIVWFSYLSISIAITLHNPTIGRIIIIKTNRIQSFSFKISLDLIVTILYQN